MTRPGRAALERLASVAMRYRQAFDEVQSILSRLQLGELPRWAFAVDGRPLEEMQDLSPELARAELLRRRWRTALHAMAELVALEGEEIALPDQDEALASLDRPSLDNADRERLDRFISVLDQARAGGCIYVNGTFQPVEPTPVPVARTHAPPSRR